MRVFLFLSSILFVLFGRITNGAELPNVYALTNARIVTSPGKAIEKGTVVVRGGVIEAVGASGAVAVPPDAHVIDLAGKTVSPGLIDPYVTESRLSGARPAPAEDDLRGRRAGPAAPAATPTPAPEPSGNVHPIARVHPEKNVLTDLKIAADVKEALRDLGFTAVAAVPDKGIFRGESAVVTLGDVSLGKSVVVPRSAQHVARDADALPFGGGEYPASKMGWVAAIRQTLSDAKWLSTAEAAYAAKPAGRPRPEHLDAWAALADAAAGKEPVVFETPDVLSLLRASKIAAEFGLKARYVGAADAYLLADEVKAAKPQLVLTLAFPPPTAVEDDDDWADVSLQRLRSWDRAPSNPRWMRDLGLTFALTTHGLTELADLTDHARKARARGLSADDLLAGFTTVPAKMLGLEGRAGEIVPGAAANLVVSIGPLFADKTLITTTWVDGVPYDVKPKKGAVPGSYRLDGARLDVRNDPRTGLLTVHATPAGGGRPVAATQVARHGQRLEFDVDGAPFGLSGPQKVTATVAGDGLKLELSPLSGGPAVTKHAERDRLARGGAGGPAGSGGGPGGEHGAEAAETAAAEKHDAPDSDVRPLPARFAAPLLAPKAVLVKNATVWTSGPEGTLTNANLLVVDGKVAAVGKGVTAPATLAGATVEIDAQGLAVTPGLIDCHSHTAIDAGVNEGTRNVSAEVRIGDVIDPFAPSIYRELAGGLTTMHVLHGSANAIGGQVEILKLRRGEGPDSLKLRDAPLGIKFALGENPKGSNRPTIGTRYPQTRMGVSALIRERFLAARDYRRRQKDFEAAKKRGESPIPPRPDLQLEAIAEILEGKRIIHAHSYVKQEVLDLLRVCEEFGVKVGTLQHILEGYKVADEIAAHGAGASSFSDWWAYKFEVYDAIPYNGALMRERGVLVSFNSDSDELARRMNVEAAKAVKYGGVPRDEALKFLTLNPAKQLRLDKRIGSLEPGKDGDFAIWSGDPLDPTSHCNETWIEGRRYFDRAADLKGRAALAAEKAELVSKSRLAAARSVSTTPAEPARRPPAHLDDADGREDESAAGAGVMR